MAATVVIPARFGSTRFPAKILAAQTGRPLVQHVVDQVRKCKRVRQIIVATDDQRIVDALKPFGTDVPMTSPAHQSGTDRIAEVARGLADEIVVNVQGDEPEIEPEIVDALIERLETHSDDDMATAATPFAPDADPANPNLVKVILAPDGRAIYFSAITDPLPARSGDATLRRICCTWASTLIGASSCWSSPPGSRRRWNRQKNSNSCEHWNTARSIYVLKVSAPHTASIRPSSTRNS